MEFIVPEKFKNRPEGRSSEAVQRFGWRPTEPLPPLPPADISSALQISNSFLKVSESFRKAFGREASDPTTWVERWIRLSAKCLEKSQPSLASELNESARLVLKSQEALKVVRTWDWDQFESFVNHLMTQSDPRPEFVLRAFRRTLLQQKSFNSSNFKRWMRFAELELSGEFQERFLKANLEVESLDWEHFRPENVQRLRSLAKAIKATEKGPFHGFFCLLNAGYGLIAQALREAYPDEKLLALSVDSNLTSAAVAECLAKPLLRHGGVLHPVPAETMDFDYEGVIGEDGYRRSQIRYLRYTGESDVMSVPIFMYVHSEAEQLKNLEAWRNKIPRGSRLAVQAGGPLFSGGFADLNELKSRLNAGEIRHESVVLSNGKERFNLICEV